MIHAHYEIPKYFDISYLNEDDLTRTNHKLWFISSITSNKEQVDIYNTPFRQHMDNVTFTKQQIKRALDCPDLPKNFFKTILSSLGDICKNRYIVLTLKRMIDPVFGKDGNNVKTNGKLIEKVDKYTSFLHRYKSIGDMKSIHISLLLEPHPIIRCCKLILTNLISSKPGTKDGISIATEEPLNNGLMLNIKLSLIHI